MMKNWIRSNWAAGARGKGQVAIAGVLLLSLVGGAGSVTWATQRAPLRYVVVLEGEDSKGHYFTTLAVASPNPWQARPIALAAAKIQGLRIVSVDEVKATGPATGSRRPRVLKAAWDKVYFPANHNCSQKHDRKMEPCGDKHEHEHEH